MPDRTWDETIGRYRSHGQVVAPRTIRTALDTALDGAAAEVRAVTQQLIDREIGLAAWQTAVEAELVPAHLAATALAHGGLAALTADEMAEATARLDRELSYLDRLAQDLADSTVPLDGRLLPRLEQYAQAPRFTYEEGARTEDDDHGWAEEQNVPESAHSCADCAAATAAGWQPLGTLSLPGERECAGNCRCTIERR